jgi:GH25 family lysozyme M1 (1,4-beta-N-acetylmuramidase)
MFRSTVAKTSVAVVAAISSVPGLPVGSLADAAGVNPSSPAQTSIDLEAQAAETRLAANLAQPHPGTPESLTHPEADHATAVSQTLTSPRTAALAPQSTATAAAQSSATTAPTQLGLDVSSYQGNVNWSQVALKGGTFAYVKATEGTYYYDSAFFPQQYNGSYAAGLIRGAYHFAIPNNSTGAAQADYFVAHGGGWSPDGHTLPGMLDIEYNPYGGTCYGLNSTQMVAWLNSFVGEYLHLTKRRPAIYTTTDWWKTCTGNATGFVDELVIANYGTTPYPLPASWTAYTIWQYAPQGIFPGDQERFNGTHQQLIEFASGRPIQASYTGSDRLLSGQRLLPGQAILSGNGRYATVMQGDGNLVEYTFGPRAVWASGTANHSGADVVMQGDGNLVIYKGSTPLWSTATWGRGPAFAAIQSDGNFVVYTYTGTALWASRSGRLY